MLEEIDSVIRLSPVSEENWENIVRNPWSTATDPYVQNLFANQGWLFYSFLMAVTVTVAFVKTESIAPPIATFLIMGVLLTGFLTITSMYYFLVATGVGIGLILYLLLK